jgi:hypothetical protein
MNREETQTVLLRYLGCLAVPIIPQDALRKWPQAGTETSWAVDTLERSLAMVNLRRHRFELLMYLLLYMAEYGRWGADSRSYEDLASTYGPYICGRNYSKSAERSFLSGLMESAAQIAGEFMEADRKKGNLKDKIAEKLERRKQQEAELEERYRKAHPMDRRVINHDSVRVYSPGRLAFDFK